MTSSHGEQECTKSQALLSSQETYLYCISRSLESHWNSELATLPHVICAFIVVIYFLERLLDHCQWNKIAVCIIFALIMHLSRSYSVKPDFHIHAVSICIKSTMQSKATCKDDPSRTVWVHLDWNHLTLTQSAFCNEVCSAAKLVLELFNVSSSHTVQCIRSNNRQARHSALLKWPIMKKKKGILSKRLDFKRLAWNKYSPILHGQCIIVMVLPKKSPQ